MPVSIIIRVIISNECSHLSVRWFALVVHIRIAITYTSSAGLFLIRDRSMNRAHIATFVTYARAVCAVNYN